MNALAQISTPSPVVPSAPIGTCIHDKWLRWHWHRAAFHRAMAESHGTHDENAVLCKLAVNEYFIWGDEQAATIGFFVQYPLLKGMNMFLAGGDLGTLLAMQPGIEAWAKTQGVSRMVGGGRIGWRRVFHDYQDAGIMMFKDI